MTHKLVYLNNGAMVLGKVVKETKSKLTLSYPCLIVFGEKVNENDTGMRLSLLPEPALTDERDFSFDIKTFMCDPLEPLSNLVDFYEKFIEAQVEFDKHGDDIIEVPEEKKIITP